MRSIVGMVPEVLLRDGAFIFVGPLAKVTLLEGGQMPTLQWLTRDEDLKRVGSVSYRLLEAVPDLSAGDQASSNMLIQGDNLDALKSLLPYHRGGVKCIYIDPPYNIGAAVGEAFDDNLQHSQWLGLMYPRLALLEQLLADGGLFACSIDDREAPYLTLLCDEIFGRKNRINLVAVKMSEASGVKMAHADKRLPKLKEWVLIYGKGERPNFDIDLIAPERWNQEYKTLLEGISDEEIALLKEKTSLQEATADDVRICQEILSRSSLRSLSIVFTELDIKAAEQDEWRYENAHRIVQAVGSASVFRLALRSPKSGGSISAALSSTGILYLFKSDVNREAKQPRVQIIFADENLMTHPGDFWADIKTTGGVGQEGGVLFPNSKKPERLMQRIIGLNTVRGDLVLDSFLGSGTTAAVAHKMQRRWIGIEMGEQAETLCYRRLCNVVAGEQSGISQPVDWQGGGGFTFYRLGESIFDADGQIRAGIGFEALAAHVWFSETGYPLVRSGLSAFLGVHNSRGYALLYNGILGDRRPNGGNVLTNATLTLIRDADGGFAGPLTVYGEASRLSEARLTAEGVTFKQTPYDVKAR